MEPFKSILVDIDSTASTHPALERAVHLAQSSGARLTIAEVMTVPPYARRYLPHDLEEDMVRQRRQQLARIAHTVTGVPVEVKLLMGRPATVLIQEVLGGGHDLLVRSHARDLTTPAPKPFGAVDMELLRKCPCPVFLVRHGGTGQHPRIVGAVNASTHLAEEQALNVTIVALTLLVARLEQGVPMLLQAWEPFAERRVRSHFSEDDFASYVEDVRQRATADMAQLVQSSGGRAAGLHATLRRGEPEDVIPGFAVSEGIDLIVMGTVARGGIAGLLFGNTAERVLRKVPCSVLAVKPEGFVCPVSLDVA